MMELQVGNVYSISDLSGKKALFIHCLHRIDDEFLCLTCYKNLCEDVHINDVIVNCIYQKPKYIFTQKESWNSEISYYSLEKSFTDDIIIDLEDVFLDLLDNLENDLYRKLRRDDYQYRISKIYHYFDARKGHSLKKTIWTILDNLTD